MVAFILACADQNQDKKSKTGEGTMENEAAAPIKEHQKKAFYPIPSPEQMFGFISDNEVPYSKKLMNSIEAAETYIQPSEKALGLGVYTADLAYAAAYQDVESTVIIYKVVKKLSNELDITNMMTEETMQKVQANMENPDSLTLIAGNAYYEAVEYLQENGQEGKLALMSLGGWIESMYITLNAIKEFDPASPEAERIASQKITFGNLYAYLKKNSTAVGVMDEIDEIQEIRSVFASLEETKSAKKTRNKGGKLVFGKGGSIKISAAQFETLKSAVIEYRSRVVGGMS